jgi:hypothetical protein
MIIGCHHGTETSIGWRWKRAGHARWFERLLEELR